MEENTTPSIFDDIAQQPWFESATQSQRLVNYIADMLVYYVFNYIVSFLLALLLALMGKTSGEILSLFSNMPFVYFIALVNMVIIYTFIEGVTKGRTLGKLITKTRAVSEDLSPLTWKQALTRTLCRAIPFEPFSALGNTPWHDKWSKTMVIKNRQEV